MYQTDLPTRAELPSSRQLLISTTTALVTAIILLVTVVLPSEFAIDPTGIGNVLGLTKMGETKNTLAHEAEADLSASASYTGLPAPPAPPMQQISQSTPAPGERADEIAVTLKSGEAAEVKLEMAKEAKVDYEWSVKDGVVNFDTHGDSAEIDYHGYSTGEGVQADSGELVGAFEGRHGWYWRNRGQGEVTVTLKTKGLYKSIKRVM